MLRLQSVRKHYDTFDLDCSLEVKPGMITGFIGANGAGKSTTFKAILNLIRIDGGEITVFGKPHTQITAKDREMIGVVLSDSGFSGYLTVNDVAAVMRQMYPLFDRADFMERCRQFGIPEKKKIKEFSTGMRAKLKLIAAMSHGARLLVLDEPTSGLDVAAREELLALLQDYLEEQEERSVLISSHISGDLEKFCDDIYMISDGKTILHEETGVLLDEYGILKVDETQYHALDQTYFKWRRKESFGYSVLTDQRSFYLENYPDVVTEKSGIDDILLMAIKGERL